MLIGKIASTSKSTTRLHPGGLMIQQWKTTEATCAPSSAADIVNSTIHDISVKRVAFHATYGRCRWSSSGQRRQQRKKGDAIFSRFFDCWFMQFSPLFPILSRGMSPPSVDYVGLNCRLQTVDKWTTRAIIRHSVNTPENTENADKTL